MKKIYFFILFFIFVLVVVYPVSAENKLVNIEKAEVDQYGLALFDPLFINQQKLEQLMDNLDKQLCKEPQNATISDNDKIIDGKPGLAIDREKFQINFRERFYNSGDEKLKVPMRKVYPRVDRSLLEEIRGKELGNYVTYYKENNKERSHNISLAATAINNYVLFPGETFSFNQVVGKRTKEKGYKRAPVIVKGELAEDIGGGICQVSSTLFNAVNLKGIQIVERYTHSREVPYVPPGKDATVSWWGPDFVFKNMYNQPILIRAFSKNGKMNIRIYSSESATYFKGNTT
ncbi:VanW family protein [Virgibacillus halodenitrificans]|uniref:VanW family protein n=1 Tax=Virgibacillus halodenitrificans TaxID=1482 RepID=UPI000EF5005C|nr:VanW family protein [Virgibacillus halodenitrificans]